jgi:hypothetical protein
MILSLETDMNIMFICQKVGKKSVLIAVKHSYRFFLLQKSFSFILEELMYKITEKMANISA